MKRTILVLIILFVTLSVQQNQAQTPFTQGVNLTSWLQTNNAKKIQADKYSKKDFENIKSLGCDIIRLPINLFYMAGEKPDYKMDPLFFEYLDKAVSWAEELKIYLMIDNHSSDDIASRNPDLEAILSKVWEQMADRYKARSKYILYEIMNEPNKITTADWSKIQQTAIDAIRKFDKKHTIVIGPSGFNTYNELAQLPKYTDKNLLYTFHFYDPFLFTHQGATWVKPSMANLANVPFPFDANKMPPLPADLNGSWQNGLYTRYPKDGNAEKIKQLIDIAVAFRDERKVPIFCGEFGVFSKNSNNADRVAWYDEVRKYLNEKKIPWTIWDYQGGFGLFQKGTEAKFPADLNLPMVKALGMKAPK